MALEAGDGAKLKLDDGAKLDAGAKLGDGATLDDGAGDWETMFVGLADITGVEEATLTTGIEVDIITTTVEVGGLKTFPVET